LSEAEQFYLLSHSLTMSQKKYFEGEGSRADAEGAVQVAARAFISK
jgi:hypothetical protein